MDGGNNSTAVASGVAFCDFSQISADVGAYFAPLLAGLPAAVVERNERRLDACTRLLEHLRTPDGKVNLRGLNPGNIARALKIGFKRVLRALKDLAEICTGLAFEAVTNIIHTQAGKTTGNRCGHHPARPRFFRPPEEHRKRPAIIRDAIHEAQRYYRNPGLLPILDAANGSTRQHRSEGREACVALLCAMLHCTDLVTLRVGRYDDSGAFVGRLMTELASLAGLVDVRPDGSLCIRRAERAMEMLVSAGIITVYPIAETDDGINFTGRAAIRTVDAALFSRLGLGGRLHAERDKATQRKKKRDSIRERREFANVRLILNASGNRQRKRAAPDPDRAEARAAEAKSKNRNQLAIEMLERHPDKMHLLSQVVRENPDATNAEIEALLWAHGGTS